MKPFETICNQCKSEEFFFHVAGNKLTIYCEHCPANFVIRLASNKSLKSEVANAPENRDAMSQPSLFENQVSESTHHAG